MNMIDNEGKIQVSLEGRIDTSNASVWEMELLNVFEANQDKKIILDAEKLEYISSSGLRIFMKLRKRAGELEIHNVSSEVYEILDMTGFTELLKIRKALRKISIDGCEKIGEGANGAVYRLDAETIVKVYREGVDLSVLETERKRSRDAFVFGIPTAISYDIVKVDKCLGLVYELLDADTVGAQVMKHPEKVEEYAEQFAKLMLHNNSIEIPEGVLPDTKDVYRDNYRKAAKYIGEENMAKLEEILRLLPDGNTYVHGDCHTKNVMMVGDEMLMIDMSEASSGAPIFDLVSAWMTLGKPGAGAGTVKYCGMTLELRDIFWKKLLSVYCNVEGDEQIEYYKKLISMIGMMRYVSTLAFMDQLPEMYQAGLVHSVVDGVLPKLDGVLEFVRKSPEAFRLEI